MDFMNQFSQPIVGSTSTTTTSTTTDSGTGISTQSDLNSSFNETISGGQQSSSAVKKAEDDLKEMQKQIESYDLFLQQLASQQKMASKKLNDMDEHIKELNKTLERERLELDAKEKEVKEKKAKFQSSKNEEAFDPFANVDPFDGDDPFKSEETNLTLPEDDPFNPSSTRGASSVIEPVSIGINSDPFGGSKW